MMMRSNLSKELHFGHFQVVVEKYPASNCLSSLQISIDACLGDTSFRQIKVNFHRWIINVFIVINLGFRSYGLVIFIKRETRNKSICDAAQVWGGPRAMEHTKECLLPRRPGC